MSSRPAEDPDLVAVDEALLRLRRFFRTPAALEHDNRSVDLSTLLVVTAIAAEPAGEASVGQIATALEVAPSTASRLVGRAETCGVVVRLAGRVDARQSLVRLTPDGVALHERARTFRHARLRAATAGFTTEEKHQFARLLTRFAAGAGS
ncbi:MULTISPECIES: MarR family winged helix-turn-helix transcriptional regulator [Micromonospora]|nr:MULTISPECIES: MarR family transcriptional regulator [Micromonospora]MBC8990817.1 MarR family transcriptional regulator [Micromonospora chalcea]MBP1781939.1 DNA-binding MarR family transcriptional regulator [Micromonospora sp. HB375]MCK1809313.1 MarR family transcriptional regulator [Micromonospora sp. R42106]MCK1834197.1 MarR family transcriptional regulator [Micromonospora sp. R42003]MCK1846169.1 MarR family transcriptional regulator [Micromonospora sp. R42004]